MVFAIYQHGLAKGIHVSPYPEPLHASLLPHPSGLSQSTGFGCPASYIKLPLAIYFMYANVYVSMLFSQIIPLSPSPTQSKSLFFVSVFSLLPCP